MVEFGSSDAIALYIFFAFEFLFFMALYCFASYGWRKSLDHTLEERGKCCDKFCASTQLYMHLVAPSRAGKSILKEVANPF